MSMTTDPIRSTPRGEPVGHRGRRHPLVWLLAIVTVAAFFAALLTAGPASSASAAAPGAISGTVKGQTVVGSPDANLANVTVNLFDAAGNLANYTYTDGAGAYSFPGIDAGTYRLGFIGVDDHADEYYNDKATLAAATGIVVAAGKTVSGLKTVLASTIGTITGTVTGAQLDGAGPLPLANVTVSLFDSLGNLANYTYTDGDGAYTFTSVPVGVYRLMFTGVDNHADEYYDDKPTLQAATTVSVAAGATVSAVNALLSSTIGGIRGTVTGAQLDGAPASPQVNATVSLYDSLGNLANYTYTDGDGAYAFTDVPIGSYRLYFAGVDNHAGEWFADMTSLETATPVAVTTGATLTGVNALLASTVGTLSGTVKGQTVVGSPDAPLANVTVSLYDSLGNLANYTYTDGAGGYTFTDVLAGSYRLFFTGVDNHADEWYNDKASLESATPITIAGAKSTTGLKTVLASTIGTITGTVKGAQSIGGATTNLPNVTVSIFDASGNLYNYTYTDGAGAYSLTSVPVGSYTVSFGDSDGYYGEWFDDKPVDSYAASVVVAPGATTKNINAVLSRTPNDHALVPAPVPTVTGTPRFASTLTVSTGTWGPGTVTKKIQWLRNGTAISGATSATYTLGAADVGATLTAAVTGSLTGFKTTTKTSAAVTGLPGLLTTATPVVTGTGKVDGVLTGAVAAWGPATVALTYQWFEGTTAIPGATALSYTPTAAQLGKSLTLTVTGTKTSYQTASTTSAAVTVLAADLASKTPSISGLAKVGEVLTAAAGTWGPAPVTLSYRWSAGGTAIPGATAASYTVDGAYAGATITVAVTGTKAGYTTKTVSSAATAAVAPGSLVPATPTITGTAKVGSKLTAAVAAWGPAPVTLTYQWKAGGVAISGATASTFTLAAAQVGKSITVSVTGTKTGYTTATSTSAATASVVPGTLTTAAPAIVGSPNVGAAVMATTSGWGPAPVTFTYQWSVDGTAVTGATAASYTPVAADRGRSLTVRVVGAKAGYTSVGVVSPAVVVLGQVLGTAVPVITGTTTVDRTLTATPGSWTPAPVTLGYQWNANGTAIAGATAATLVLGSAQAGATITVTVTGTKSGFETASVTSAATAAVATGTLTGPTPTISGTATIGSTLTATAGTWGPAPVTLSYQWKANGVAISGATSSSYVVDGSVAGKAITVTVTGKKAGYATASRTSGATGIVPVGTITGSTPTISGSPLVGQTLTANPGTWSPSSVTLGYQWFVGGTAVTGATSSSYLVKTADIGKTITVTVTATKTGYTTLSRSSAATAAVKSGTLTSSTPTISGTAKVGQVLTANPGSWGPSGVALSYSWKVGGSAVASTSSSYTAVAGDLGKSVTVTVTGALTGYTTVSKTSAATAAVVAGTITPGALTLTGTARVGETLTAHIGSWGPAPVTTNIQWYRNGGVIVGATGPTRVLVPADLGGVLTFKVGGKKEGYTTVTTTSPASAAVALGTLSGPIPSMSGTLKVGQKLTANLNGAWGPAPVALEYRWTADAVAIPGANGPTFTLTSAQLGKKIIIKVIGTKAGYADLGRQSPYSVPVVK